MNRFPKKIDPSIPGSGFDDVFEMHSFTPFDTNQQLTERKAAKRADSQWSACIERRTEHRLTFFSFQQSLPRILAQILFTGTQIIGRAFAEAGRQAVRSKGDHIDEPMRRAF